MDCRVLTKEGWFSYRAAAIIIEEGYVLAVTSDICDYFYSVGGAVELHETSEEAVLREVYEETGLRYEIDRLVFIHENFWMSSSVGVGALLNDENNTKSHEISFYFLMKPKGCRNIIDNESFGMFGNRESFAWLEIERIKEYKLYPIFFYEYLNNLPGAVTRIVTKEY